MVKVKPLYNMAYSVLVLNNREITHYLNLLTVKLCLCFL